MPNEIVKTKTINNVDVTPLIQEVLEYSKSQATLGNVEELISKVPQKDSMDWKLISGVLCNAVIEWVAEDKDNRVALIHHLQSEVGYVLKRMGLTM
jgi:ribonuclease D